jgi:hypothetical protein
MEKEASEFSFKDKAKGVRSAYCRQCMAEYQRDWHQRNKTRRNKDARRRKAVVIERNRKVIAKYLETGCQDCGISDPRVLDFDHVGPKRNSIANLLRWATVDTLEAEIRKCEVVCANCHRIRTGNRGKWWWT